MILLYDGTFEGFLSVIFYCYARNIVPLKICNVNEYQESLFISKETIPSVTEHSDRVWKAWQHKLSPRIDQLPYLAFLSSEPDIEMKLFRFAKMSFSSSAKMESNFGDPDVLEIRKAARRVQQEAMRMMQFVRFQKTKDDIFFAGISPRYDVLPMILYQLQDRFADQQWLVYDIKRDYGFYHDLHNLKEVIVQDKSFCLYDGQLNANALHEEEIPYQNFWVQYCQSITIRERLNLNLQKQHMPKRYWKYLTEKKNLR
jgi:probable DNA metabolism protein